jgi:pimeloyl-ACP methyl ester carboxylesterase
MVGHDWGGIVAQEVALLIPNRVKMLVIMNISIITNMAGTIEALDKINSRGGIAFWYQYFQRQPFLPEAMIKGNEKVWVSYFFGKAGMEGLIPAESIEEYIRCYSIENTPATAASYYRVKKLDNQHWAEIGNKKFTMPCLYIHGSDDPVIIPEFLNHIEDCFDSIQVKSLKAGHFVQEEKPYEVAEVMNAFFQLT